MIKPYLDIVLPILEAIDGFHVSLDPTDIIRLVREAVTLPLKPYHLRIQEFIREIKPVVKMYNETIGELTKLTSEMEGLQTHLKNKIAEDGWDVEVPELPIPPIPSIPLVETIPSTISSCDSALSGLTGIPPIKLSDDKES